MKKRSKMLVLILVLAFALTGVGYAAWTDQLNIDGTVKTGKLDVDFVSGQIFGFTYCPAIATFDEDVTTDIKYIDENTCEVTIGNLYPGAAVFFDVAQKNKGSIPVKFDKATLTYTGDQELFNYLQARADYVADTDGGIFNILDGNVKAGNIMDFGPLANLDDAMTAKLQNLVLQPGGWICFSDEEAMESTSEQPSCIHIKLAENAPDTTQGKSITFTLKMDWKQFNK